MSETNQEVEADYTVEQRGFVSPCWIWRGYRVTRGYGGMFRGGKNIRAHRHYYEMHKGSIPAGMVVDHLCRNTSCVNPEHLEAVSSKLNTRRGTVPVLNEEKVAYIKSVAGGDQSMPMAAKLAKELAVNRFTVYSVLIGKSWKDIQPKGAKSVEE